MRREFPLVLLVPLLACGKPDGSARDGTGGTSDRAPAVPAGVPSVSWVVDMNGAFRDSAGLVFAGRAWLERDVFHLYLDSGRTGRADGRVTWHPADSVILPRSHAREALAIMCFYGGTSSDVNDVIAVGTATTDLTYDSLRAAWRFDQTNGRIAPAPTSGLTCVPSRMDIGW